MNEEIGRKCKVNNTFIHEYDSWIGAKYVALLSSISEFTLISLGVER